MNSRSRAAAIDPIDDLKVGIDPEVDIPIFLPIFKDQFFKDPKIVLVTMKYTNRDKSKITNKRLLYRWDKIYHHLSSLFY